MVMVMAFTLAAVLLLSLGGANGIALFFFVRLPLVIGDLTGGAIGAKTTPPAPSANQVISSAIGTLILAIILGFLLGGVTFPSLKAGNVTISAHRRDRFIGIIPGIITGFAVDSYIGHFFAVMLLTSVVPALVLLIWIVLLISLAIA